MSKGRATPASADKVISIIGPGMHVVGDCDTTDTIRIEGRVEGSVRAEKAVVIGKGGCVNGDIKTQDAVIAGTVKGALDVDSRLELQETCVIDGEIRATRLKLDEGGMVTGTVSIGRRDAGAAVSAGTMPGGQAARPHAAEKPSGRSRPAKAKAAR